MDPNEEIPVRSPITTGPGPAASDRDESEYSTLEVVNVLFKQAIEDLRKDFNALDLSEKLADIKTQIAGRQMAYDILDPLQQQVQSAIDNVRLKQEGQ